eukprot:jgi/Chlat1/4480/Chrsp29S08890
MKIKAQHHAALYLRVKGMFHMRGLQERFEEYLSENLTPPMPGSFGRIELYRAYLEQTDFEVSTIEFYASK